MQLVNVVEIFWSKINVSENNGRHQAIARTNVEQDLQYHMASPDHDSIRGYPAKRALSAMRKHGG